MSAKKTTKATAESAEIITAYKGFDASMQCRGYQYKIGETYKHAGEVKVCESGLHSCENPLDVFSYYPPGVSVFAEVEASGKIARHNGDSKVASGKLHVKAMISLPDYIGRAIAWATAHCDPSTSKHAEAERAASSATGYRSASSATGIAAVAMSIGRFGRAKASEGAAIVLCEHDDKGNLLHIRASRVGDNGIEPDVFYMLVGGEFVKWDVPS